MAEVGHEGRYLSLYNVDPQLQDVETFSTPEFYCKL